MYNSIHPQGEVRPIDTAESRPFDFTPPLMSLRAGYRRPITPETCRVRHCPICQWLREGLLGTAVVREASVCYGPSGVASTACACPHCSYSLGREHGLADGPDHRPDAEWLAEAGLDACAYLRGYDEGCRARTTLAHDTPLWDARDACLDGMPF